MPLWLAPTATHVVGRCDLVAIEQGVQTRGVTVLNGAHEGAVRISTMLETGLDPGKLRSVFSLRVRGVQLVVPSEHVSGVIAFEPPTRVPRTPSHIMGLLPYGDGALAVVDLGEFLGLSETGDSGELTATRRVVVTHHEGLEAGMLCDQTQGVMAFDGSSLEPATVLKSGRMAEFVAWEVDGKSSRVGLLNLALVLESARVASSRSER